MKKETKKYYSNIQFILLILLILFLPLSSWLVSLTGQPSLSLIRDVLVILIFILVVFSSFCHSEQSEKSDRSRNKSFVLLRITIITFILYGLLSYLWREASPMQWLRGFRFTFIPFLLLFSLINLDLKQSQKNTLIKMMLFGGIMISTISFLEFIGIKIPLTTHLSGDYGLEVTQYIQGNGERRLQSLLAGPNALGLYMLALVAYAFGLFNNLELRNTSSFPRRRESTNRFTIVDPRVKPEDDKRKTNKKLIWLTPIFILILILTFSRSSLIGLIVILILVGATYLHKKIGLFKSVATLTFTLIILISLGLNISKSGKYDQYITHGTSSTLRTIQYQRIWDTKGEIGLLGRGMGTAGPSSQNRFDGGPNHWTENIYLDIFEELGYIGLALYLTLLGSLFYYSTKNYNTYEGKTAFLINISFGIAGLFINIYTGQVGIYLLILANGLLINSGRKENSYGKNID